MARFPLTLLPVALVAALALAACDRPAPPAARLSEPTTPASQSAGGIEAPYAAIVPADAQPPGAAASNPSGGSTSGAETSRSSATGPGNGSTAVGGVVGNQAAGGGSGHATQPTAGDGRR